MAIAKELEDLWEENFEEFLLKDHGVEMKLLLRSFENFKKKEVNAEDLIFEAKAVSDRTWEKLNVGKWMNVPKEWKQVYAMSSYVQVVGLLHTNRSNVLEKCLELVDMGILLGFPFRSLSLTRVADILTKYLKREERILEVISTDRSHLEEVVCVKKAKLENEIQNLECPSLEHFYGNYFTKNVPVKLTGCIDHWPALNLWKDFGYIVKKAGHRMVPVELGKHYADESYSQKLMRIADFVNEFFREDSEEIGYLAQHQLFDQVPELRRDILEPDYCALSEKSNSSGQTEVNAWFGPKGTVSPLHFDPKHNLLTQVVGSKKIILFSQEDSKYLYPHEGSLLFNTSRVDVENPDLSNFPDFSKASKKECLLNPGEMLYIPPRYWHHVRSLSNSFSVSFWWE